MKKKDQPLLPGPVALRTARIDDHLIERHETRLKLEQLLDTVTDTEDLSPNDIRILRRKARKAGPDVLRQLVEIYAGETSTRADVAFLVLNDFPEPQLQPALMEALADPKLAQDTRVRLLALGTFDPDREADMEYVFDVIGARPTELIQAFTAAVGDRVEPEELALMWLADFADLPRDERLSLISFFMDEGLPQFMPALEIEAHSTHWQVRGAIARGLRKFECREAMVLAQRLSHDRNPTVRYDAHATMDLLGKIENPEWQFAPPKFYECWWSPSPELGSATVLYIARDQRKRFKVCSLLLDTWNRGIVDVWGNLGLSMKDMQDLVADYENEAKNFGVTDMQLIQVDRAEVLFLIEQCVRLSDKRHRRMPPEFHVWERLFRHEEFTFDGSKSLFKFELKCSDCSSMILPNRLRTNVFLDEQIALCRKCLLKERECSDCKRHYRLGDLHDWDILQSYHCNCCDECITTQWAANED